MTDLFNPGLLDGEIALVTGGGSGIGLAIAEMLAAHGCDTAILGRSAERLEKASDAIATTTGRLSPTLVCDVRDAAAVQEAVREVGRCFGPVSILVNNAAANFAMPAARMTARALSTVVDIDLLGTFNLTRACLDEMTAQARGCVLNIVVPDAERGFPGFAHAGAAKAGIVSLTRSWAREWGPLGIRVNALGPGPVPTEGVAANMLGLGAARTGDAFAGSVDRIPLGRLGTVEDIAAAATFLCSPAASWITGISLNVDGGMNVA